MATRGLGDTDPLARRRRLPSVIPAAAEEPVAAAADEEEEHTPARAPAKSTKVIPRAKRQVTAYIDAGVVDDARNAVLALMPNPAGHRTLSALIEHAVQREVARLSAELNDGKPFPRRQVELQPGRPGGN